MKIYLASESPRRRQLLTQAGIPHEVVPGGVDESIAEDLPPGEMVRALALRKAEAAAGRVPDGAVIVAADTLVFWRGQVLGKPSDAEEAFAMLKKLQGGAHTVYTGVALLHKETDRRQSFAERAEVYFRSLSDEAIRRYIQSGEPMDKAGAYGIQERGACLVTRVEGDFYTVMGLPLARLCMALEEWGLVF